MPVLGDILPRWYALSCNYRPECLTRRNPRLWISDHHPTLPAQSMPFLEHYSTCPLSLFGSLVGVAKCGYFKVPHKPYTALR